QIVARDLRTYLDLAQCALRALQTAADRRQVQCQQRLGQVVELGQQLLDLAAKGRAIARRGAQQRSKLLDASERMGHSGAERRRLGQQQRAIQIALIAQRLDFKLVPGAHGIYRGIVHCRVTAALGWPVEGVMRAMAPLSAACSAAASAKRSPRSRAIMRSSNGSRLAQDAGSAGRRPFTCCCMTSTAVWPREGLLPVSISNRNTPG